MPIIANFDILKPEPQIIIMGGVEIDVSFFPVKIALDMMDFVGKAKGEFEPEMFGDIVNLVVDIIQVSQKDLNKEWVLANMSPITIMNFLKLAISTLTGSMAAASLGTSGTGGGAGSGDGSGTGSGTPGTGGGDGSGDGSGIGSGTPGTGGGDGSGDGSGIGKN
jgi:hypothetical protein